MPEIDNHRYHLLTILLCLCDIRSFNGIHMYTMYYKDNIGSLKTKSEFFNVSACRFFFFFVIEFNTILDLILTLSRVASF